MLDGEDMSGLSLFDISKKVGSVFQNPRSQFFNVDTTSEIAFGCENHGLEEAEIRKRVKLVSEQLTLQICWTEVFSPFPVGKSKKSPVDLPPLWNRMYLFWTSHLPTLTPIPSLIFGNC